MKCNCESTHCDHEPAACQEEGKIKFDYIGKVCLACADVMPKEFLLDIPLGTIILFDNRFGILREYVDKNDWGYRQQYLRCEGIRPSTFYMRGFTINSWDYDKMILDVKSKSLYEFEEAIGENVYDSFAYARNCRILETTKNASGRYGESVRPEYWVKAYNPDTDQLIWLTVDRYDDGHLRWGKTA